MENIICILLIGSVLYSGYYLFRKPKNVDRSSSIPISYEEASSANKAINVYNRVKSPVKYTKVCDAEIVQLEDGHKMIKLSQSETIKSEKNILIQ